MHHTLKFVALATLIAMSACSNLDNLSERYTSMTTSRTVGHWKGEQTCTTENPGAHQVVEMKLKAWDMPLTSTGLLRIERTHPSFGQPAIAWIKVHAESGVNNTAIIEGQEVLKQGGPIQWATQTWVGTFRSGLQIDDSILLTACGAPLLLKRQQPNTPSTF